MGKPFIVGLSILSGCGDKENYDVLLRGGTVVDGTDWIRAKAGNLS
jgi:hypothetical protein